MGFGVWGLGFRVLRNDTSKSEPQLLVRDLRPSSGRRSIAALSRRSAPPGKIIRNSGTEPQHEPRIFQVKLVWNTQTGCKPHYLSTRRDRERSPR